MSRTTTIYSKRVGKLKKYIDNVESPLERRIICMNEFLGLKYCSRTQQAWAKRVIIEWRDQYPEMAGKWDALDEKVELAADKLIRRRELREAIKKNPSLRVAVILKKKLTATDEEPKPQPVVTAPTLPVTPGGLTPWD